MYRILEQNPALKQYEGDINLRMSNYENKRKQILQGEGSLTDFANAHHYFGIHKQNGEWVYREWAPAADALYLTGDFNSWNWTSHPLKKIDDVTGVWEITLNADTLHQGSKLKTIVRNGDRLSEHVPIYAKRAVQDPGTYMWCCEAWDPQEPYPWTDKDFKCDEVPLIYEAHVGMSCEEERIATYREFADNILPIVKKDGYNTIQLMAIMEHPYYGSFGYQVSNFFAPSSRYGLPEDLKYLINKAHSMGIRVLLDVVHSHAVKNTTDGINLFDGTTEQFFHTGARGEHTAWGTKCFNYDKPEVIHFLLSNLKYWLEEFHFDGFRFDGVTSMLYHDHGLGSSFDNLNKYFSMNTDTEAVTYLQLANELIHEIKPDAITIAEDMSGMPGMCVPIEDGGIGFDYRLAMGLPDMWIKLVKESADEFWNVEKIWSELCLRSDPTIAYVESHDQALVGDKTMMFRLADAAMYTDMNNDCHSLVIDRAVALHKMIRLVTIAGGGNGYLNFMGNEFGHPEWIDFPREGNGNSYKYCRRQWSLVNNDQLKYQALGKFDQAMIQAVKENHVFDENFGNLRSVHVDNHTLAFERGDLLFVFNFHPTRSFTDYEIPVGKNQDYEVLFSTDDKEFDGYDMIPKMRYSTKHSGRKDSFLKLYVPSRTAIVLRPCKTETNSNSKTKANSKNKGNSKSKNKSKRKGKK